MQTSITRIFLLLFISLILLLMLGGAGLHDSRRYHEAYRAQRNAPSEETQQALQEAKRLDLRGMMIFECVMLGVLGLSIYAFIRAGKSVKNPPA